MGNHAFLEPEFALNTERKPLHFKNTSNQGNLPYPFLPGDTSFTSQLLMLKMVYKKKERLGYLPFSFLPILRYSPVNQRQRMYQ